MDGSRFDSVVQSLVTTAPRRGVLRALASLPLLQLLAMMRDPAATVARGHALQHGHQARPQHRRSSTARSDHSHPHDQQDAQQRRDRATAQHQHKRKKRAKRGTGTCTPESAAQTCAGRCGKVTNTCGTAIDCGACSCGSCQICQFCDASTGQCVPNGSVVGQVCTSCHTCTAAGLCERVANGTSCDDGNACTQTATSQDGVCVGINPMSCPAPRNPCHAAVCNPATGMCSEVDVPDGTACNPGSACSSGTCQSGVCHDACTAPATCCPAGTPAAGECRRLAGTGACGSDADCCSGSCAASAGCCPTCPAGCVCGSKISGDLTCTTGSGSGQTCNFDMPCPAGEACFGFTCRTTCEPVA